MRSISSVVDAQDIPRDLLPCEGKPSHSDFAHGPLTFIPQLFDTGYITPLL